MYTCRPGVINHYQSIIVSGVTLSTTGSTDVVENVARLYPQLTVEVGVHDRRNWEIIQGGIGIEPNSQTPLYNPRAVTCSDSDSLVTCKFEAMFLPEVCGRLPEDNEYFHEVLQTLLPGSGYFLFSAKAYHQKWHIW